MSVTTFIPNTVSDEHFVHVGPVSENQHRALFLEALRPDDPPAMLRAAILLPSGIDSSRLHAAFRCISRVQEVFRTRFERSSEGFVQFVSEEGGLEFDEQRFEGSAEELVRSLKEDGLFEILQPPIGAFQQAPLARATLLRCDDGAIVLAVSFHHVIFDGMSSAIFMRQLIEFYSADNPEALMLSMRRYCAPYREFVAYQHEHLSGSRALKLLGFWRRYLDGVIPYPSSTNKLDPFCALETEIQFDAFAVDTLNLLCRRHALTPHVLLLGCFQLAIAAVTGERSILTGTPVKNRPSRFADTVGLFVNPVVIRNVLDINCSLLDNILSLRSSACQVYRHGSFPLRRIISGLFPDFSAQRKPLFHSWFSIQVITADADFQAANNFTVFNMPAGRAVMVDHALELQSIDGALCGHLVTDSRVDANGATARAFLVIVDAMINNSSIVLGELLNALLLDTTTSID
ncbi:condensation domain-containing protein [Methylobacter sp.]|jgi:hypothetical protein|uniref:condensation domain-containing protein n=1 Tax=Methylobacter sp. TaxID=2051955 RepID=UPI003DA4A40C